MTATSTLDRASTDRPGHGGLRRWRRRETVPVSRAAAPPLSPRLQLLRASLMLVFVLSFTLILQLVLVSSFQHSASQRQAFDAFRERLALGTAPIGPADADGAPVGLGTGVAYMEIRTIGLEEVVLEGTTSGVLFDGAGHRRDTPLPGQVGTSVIFGRRAAFGGPFSDITDLRADDVITVTTGQGTFDYKVIGVRHEGDPAPGPVAAGRSRLVLTTADGTAFLPTGVVRVDADIVTDPVVGPPRAVSSAALPASERAMAGDSSTLWAFALWLQALIVLAIGAVWAWHRWGRAQAWVVFLPPMMLVGLCASGEVARLLPNLL